MKKPALTTLVAISLAATCGAGELYFMSSTVKSRSMTERNWSMTTADEELRQASPYAPPVEHKIPEPTGGCLTALALAFLALKRGK